MLLKFKVLGLISIYFSHVPYIYFVFPIEDAKSFIERLDDAEKVYTEEIYTFIIEHFHELNNNETMWKILLVLEQCGSGRG